MDMVESHIFRRGLALLIRANLSSNTQFIVVLDPPTPLKRGQKTLVPPFLRGVRGDQNLGGTSKNFEMLIRLRFHVKLTPMSIAKPLQPGLFTIIRIINKSLKRHIFVNSHHG